MIYYCAFNFPAVLYCYGPENWEQLKGVYLYMANERDKKVKTSIASSIAEVAQLIDSSLVEKDILPIFDKFYRDESKNNTLYTLYTNRRYSISYIKEYAEISEKAKSNISKRVF